MLKFRLRDFWRQLLITCLLYGGGTARADDLGDALRAALRNHPAVAGQAAKVESRRYAADEARSQRYPTLSAQAQQYAKDVPSAVPGEDLSRPAILRVRQPIWSFGRISNSIEAANAEVSTERADLLRVRRQLIEQTAVAYALVRGSRDGIDLARQNVAEHEVLLEQIQRRVEGQLASSADARLAATRLVQARAQLERAISEWEVSQVDLAGLTQQSLSADAPVPPALMELQDATGLTEAAMENSAEIHLKQQQLGQAEAEVDQARSSYMPTIYLQADRYHDQPGVRDNSRVSVVFEATLDGLGLAARGRSGEARASQEAASQDLAATKVELRRALDRLQRNRELQAELIQLQTQSLSDLESLLASYQRQYESGTKSWLDLLNIQRELFEQRHQLLLAQNDWVINSLQLQAMTGGLDGLAGVQEPEDD